jgi:hypothetical protein
VPAIFAMIKSKRVKRFQNDSNPAAVYNKRKRFISTETELKLLILELQKQLEKSFPLNYCQTHI